MILNIKVQMAIILTLLLFVTAINGFTVGETTDPHNTFIVLYDEFKTGAITNPTNISVTAGTIEIVVCCIPAEPIKAWEFKVHFNNTLLNATNVSEGSIFGAYTTFFSSGIIDNANGTIINVYNLIVGTGNVSEYGSLINITFDVIAPGIASIWLEGVGVTNETQYLSTDDYTTEGAYDGVCYHNSGGNAYFTTNHSLLFDQIELDAEYIKFNNTGFYITSPNKINVSVDFINSSTNSSSINDSVLKFYAHTTGGNVFFNISGFKPDIFYRVYADGVYYKTERSNLSGFISFNYSSWSEHYFEVENYDTEGDYMDIYISSVYPANTSTEVERPATNLSVIVNGTGVDVYFYFINYTGTSNTTTLLASWNSVDTQRFSFTDFGWPGKTDWMWGNTKYYWSVNVTNGTSWVNKTFGYTSVSYVNDDNARYDTWLPIGLVSGTDAQRMWNSMEYDFNRIYDISEPFGLVSGTDVIRVWNEINN